MLKQRFGRKPETELSIDQYDAPFTIFSQQDEDERYDRHIKPIRKAQACPLLKSQSEIMQDELEPIWHTTEHDESDDLEDAKRVTHEE